MQLGSFRSGKHDCKPRIRVQMFQIEVNNIITIRHNERTIQEPVHLKFIINDLHVMSRVTYNVRTNNPPENQI